MGDKTGISWTDATWNPVRGCSRVSEGCRNCYAERVAARFSGPGMPYEGLADSSRKGSKWTGEVRFVTEHLADPLRWKRPRRIFVNSMSDLFHEKLTNEQIAAVFGVMAAAPQHTFQVLTKRAKRMREWFEWVQQQAALARDAAVVHYEDTRDMEIRLCLASADTYDVERRHVEYPAWPLPNVWLGVSVEDQDATARIVPLLECPAAVRFLSCEPLLGPLDFAAASPNARSLVDDLDWVIVGCESGFGARAYDVDWMRSIRDQCAKAGVALFLKQAFARDGAMTITNIRPIPIISGRLGELIPTIGIGAGSREKGRGLIELPYLDGVQHAAFPVPA